MEQVHFQGFSDPMTVPVFIHNRFEHSLCSWVFRCHVFCFSIGHVTNILFNPRVGQKQRPFAETGWCISTKDFKYFRSLWKCMTCLTKYPFKKTMISCFIYFAFILHNFFSAPWRNVNLLRILAPSDMW